jgi:hypothetical protein
LRRLSILAWAAAVSAACTADMPARSRASYDPDTGRLRRLETDTDQNGRPDVISYMDGARILRIEIDRDENGVIERWDFYDGSGRLEKVGLSRANDGVMDAVAFYDPAGVLTRMVISTKKDLMFDRIEHYEKGVLVRSEEDADGDGRPDKWDTYERRGSGQPASYAVLVTEFDDAGRGRPDRRFVYRDDGSVLRVELDRDGDGVFQLVEPRP